MGQYKILTVQNYYELPINCLIDITKWQLVMDVDSQAVILQMKATNLGKLSVNSLRLQLKFFSIDGEQVGRLVDYLNQDEIEAHKTVALQPLVVPKEARSVEIKLKNYLTSDGVLHNDKDIKFYEHKNESLTKYFKQLSDRYILSDDERVLPVINNGLWWQCSCGKLNPTDQKKCALCDRLYDDSMKYLGYISVINQQLAETQKRDKENREQIKLILSLLNKGKYVPFKNSTLDASLENLGPNIDKYSLSKEDAKLFISSYTKLKTKLEEKSLKEKKKKTKIFGIVFVSLCALVLLTIYLFIPAGKYIAASQYTKMGEYDKAREIYDELGDFGQSETKYYETYYLEADYEFNNYDYSGAAHNFWQAGDFNDAPTRVLISYYYLGNYQYSQKNYLYAASSYTNAKDYQDASSKALLSYYYQGKEYYKAMNYESAAHMFNKAKDFMSDAASLEIECYYLAGDKAFNNESYKSAALYFLIAGTYRDAETRYTESRILALYKSTITSTDLATMKSLLVNYNGTNSDIKKIKNSIDKATQLSTMSLSKTTSYSSLYKYYSLSKQLLADGWTLPYSLDTITEDYLFYGKWVSGSTYIYRYYTSTAQTGWLSTNLPNSKTSTGDYYYGLSYSESLGALIVSYNLKNSTKSTDNFRITFYETYIILYNYTNSRTYTMTLDSSFAKSQ
ncbi:MAG: hypothetical protein PHY11_03120 [Bacilli bacterium]|nr:hypothetical protein [Bacilli bacterium]MDD3422708.1 hypothetical protein [Bacilli bacterium]MDD4065969.1 hypothetical protein [Bacilli bacterium]